MDSISGYDTQSPAVKLTLAFTDFHDGVKLPGVDTTRPVMKSIETARARLEQATKPSPAELTGWAAWGAACVFLARRTTSAKDGFNPAGVSTLNRSFRLPAGGSVRAPGEPPPPPDVVLMQDAAWIEFHDLPGVLQVMVQTGGPPGWEDTTAGQFIHGLALICSTFIPPLKPQPNSPPTSVEDPRPPVGIISREQVIYQTRDYVTRLFKGDWAAGFKHFDLDGDGRLSKAEVIAYLSVAQIGWSAMRGIIAAGIFSEMDKDRDGFVSQAEFITAVSTT